MTEATTEKDAPWTGIGTLPVLNLQIQILVGETVTGQRTLLRETVSGTTALCSVSVVNK